MCSTHAGAAKVLSAGAAARSVISAVHGSENSTSCGTGAMCHSGVSRMHVTDGNMVLVRSESLFGNGKSAPAAAVSPYIETAAVIEKTLRDRGNDSRYRRTVAAGRQSSCSRC